MVWCERGEWCGRESGVGGEDMRVDQGITLIVLQELFIVKTFTSFMHNLHTVLEMLQIPCPDVS